MKIMFRTLVLLIGMVSFSTLSSAQKIAHVNTDSLVSELALRDSVQQKLEAKQAEYQAEYQKLADEYAMAEAEYNRKKADPNNSPAVLALAKNKVDQVAQRANQFEQAAGTELQNFELKLMEPLIDRIKKAIEEVAKEKGYAYVINDQVLLVSPSGDDITNLVRKKLGL
ncbi:MAG: OmpH family outer membrane protein [Bacteroidota bacterium]|nr:OmpH family outer membrane protein [Bacteroidota bacterium]MDX5431239.1 OmpH family outer membrane protein [Bacteroidota bacterium]MDX5469978.1 OmpH family outer membrane protein [Bacteroidota bacterium]